MEFTQEMSRSDYKRAILKHYFAFGFTYINLVMGILLIAAFIYKLFPLEAFENKSFLYLLGGVFLILRPWIYVSQIASVYRQGEMKFEINEEDELTLSQNGKSSTINIKELYAFADRGQFVFLYMTKFRFHVIDKRQAGGDFLRYLDGILGKYGIIKK